MSARSRWALAALAISLSAALGGCEGCGAERRVRAQALDAGVVVPPVLPSPTAPAICYVAASEQTDLLDDQIFGLCQGAPTATGPVECYVAATRRLMLTDQQRVALCRCAPSAEPVDCVEMLERETRLLEREIEQLCAPTLARGLLESCVPRTG